MNGQTDNGGCPPDCGHSEAEHEAFDRGVEDGEAGRNSDDWNPYSTQPIPENESLSRAYLTGHEVGDMNAVAAFNERKKAESLS